MSAGRVYLDHAATTPMRPEALAAMHEALEWNAGGRGNPSGQHAAARAARRALDDARDVLGALVGVPPGEVVFTSGGTESDNLAIAGAAEVRPGAIVVSAVEHRAVGRAAEAAARRLGRELRTVRVDAAGRVDLGDLERCLTGEVAVVSVMAANNEVGTVQPLEEVAGIVRDRAPGAALHTDAVQAAPWCDLAAAVAGADLVSLSAHKFGGPMGVGVLALRPGTAIAAQLHGGAQERERRAGTQNVAGIAATAAAAALLLEGAGASAVATAELRDRFLAGLADRVPGATPTVDPGSVPVLPGHAHVRFAGVDAEALLALLDDLGVEASAGSSCASGALEPSHVLVAMGVGGADLGSAVRFSLGWTTTAGDVDAALARVADAVGRLQD